MKRQELLKLKRAPKVLREIKFRSVQKGAYPRPFDKLSGSKLRVSGLIDVGDDRLKVMFLWKDGDILERRSFYGYLMTDIDGVLVPLAIMHYHPSHKGLHMLTNCEVDRDFSGRLLPGARELAMSTPTGIDPSIDSDRNRLVNIFCERCGIRISPDDNQLL